MLCPVWGRQNCPLLHPFCETVPVHFMFTVQLKLSLSNQSVKLINENTVLINPRQNDKKYQTFLIFLETNFKNSDAQGKGNNYSLQNAIQVPGKHSGSSIGS